MDERLEDMTIIACKWNARQLEPNDAMVQIWKLFSKENLKTWNTQRLWDDTLSETI